MSIEQTLQGRRALVTGASRGIGRATAIELARRGAAVAINFLNSKQDAIDVAEVIDAGGGDVMLIKADVSKIDDVTAMIEQVTEQFGGLDIVVSNAAAGGFRDIDDITPVNFEAIIRNNAAPVLWLVQAARKHLSTGPGNGKFLAISSHGSQWVVPHYAAIGASKAALESLIRHMALEFGHHGINFNCVLPGIVATDAIASMPGSADLIAAAGERMLVPRREVTVEDVAGAVAFLCGPQSDMIQGQTLVVDGGVGIRV